MSDPAKVELLRSLRRLVRGLSALFWGLPLMLVIYVQTARTDWLDLDSVDARSIRTLAMLPSLLVTAVLFYGLGQMRHFQRQERIWMRALDRARLLVFINLGLCPFLYWWRKMPHVHYYTAAVAVLACSCVFLLFNLNHVLQRLAAMLPDETLRAETGLFTSFNRPLLLAIPVLSSVYFGLTRLPTLPPFLIAVLAAFEPFDLWLALFLFLVPLAMTMALIWKIKEEITAGVFGGH